MPSQAFLPSGAIGQPWVVPAGVTSIVVDAYGAAGGAFVGSGSPGSGGRVRCRVSVTPGETLYVWAGARPTALAAGGVGAAIGGNTPYAVGGGSAAEDARKGNGGGGASAISRGTGTAWADQAEWLVIAPGGGGAASVGSANGGHGGTPNGTAGGNASTGPITGGGGATSSSGGSGGVGSISPLLNGSAGASIATLHQNGGGSGGSFSDIRGGGAGGGGYFGGGGSGVSNPQSAPNGGGGGGSGLSTGVDETLQTGVNPDDGWVTITWPGRRGFYVGVPIGG